MSFQNEFSSLAQSASLPTLQGVHFKNNLGVFTIIGHYIIWFLLTIVTFGLALFVFPYYMQRYIINNTGVFDAEGKKIGQLKCEIDLATIIGNIVLWVILSIITLGFLYVVFLYKIHAHCYSHTKIVSVNPHLTPL